MRRILLGVGLALLACHAHARQYDFCATQIYDASTVVTHVTFHYGDIDPSREGARVIVAAKLKDVGVKSVQVSNFDPRTCPTQASTSIQVTASWDQLQRLANQAGAGDIPDAAITAGTIVAGGAVNIVKGAGQILGGIKLKVPKIGTPKIKIHIKPPPKPKLPHCNLKGCRY